jgi:Domain of unknown function DUF302
MTVFATIDHQAAAHAVGLDMPPTTVLIVGNPKSGTPLMLAAPDFAMDLPLRVLVREDAGGRTWLVYDTAAAFEGRHGLPANVRIRLRQQHWSTCRAVGRPCSHSPGTDTVGGAPTRQHPTSYIGDMTPALRVSRRRQHRGLMHAADNMTLR